MVEIRLGLSLRNDTRLAKPRFALGPTGCRIGQSEVCRRDNSRARLATATLRVTVSHHICCRRQNIQCKRDLSMKLPSVKECEALFRQYHVPKNIEAHCKAVSVFAFSIAQKLQEKSVSINIELVKIGALLHDLMKAVTLESLDGTGKFAYTPNSDEIAMWKQLRVRYPGIHETEITSKLLSPNYPELAKFLKDEGNASLTPTFTSWEVKVVHYADWRFIGTTFVPLNVRMDDIFQRYARKNKIGGIKDWDIFVSEQRKAEKEISDALQCSPEDL